MDVHKFVDITLIFIAGFMLGLLTMEFSLESPPEAKCDTDMDCMIKFGGNGDPE